MSSGKERLSVVFWKTWVSWLKWLEPKKGHWAIRRCVTVHAKCCGPVCKHYIYNNLNNMNLRKHYCTTHSRQFQWFTEKNTPVNCQYSCT